jgi:hypothetical protein
VSQRKGKGGAGGRQRRGFEQYVFTEKRQGASLSYFVLSTSKNKKTQAEE